MGGHAGGAVRATGAVEVVHAICAVDAVVHYGDRSGVCVSRHGRRVRRRRMRRRNWVGSGEVVSQVMGEGEVTVCQCLAKVDSAFVS